MCGITGVYNFARGEAVEGDVALVLSSLVDYKAETAWADMMRARGVKVLFVRLPSSGAYLEFEKRYFPRVRTWDALLTASGAPVFGSNKFNKASSEGRPAS